MSAVRTGAWHWQDSQLGLTAVELMVVLAVIGVLGFAVYAWLSSVREVLMVFTVDTSPASCLNTITVTLYGGVRMAGW